MDEQWPYQVLIRHLQGLKVYHVEDPVFPKADQVYAQQGYIIPATARQQPRRFSMLQ